ncbi:MAG: DEAD/DEAH box helicase [Deltaproteobacteria bacterium]|nr:DEAD/DEAH box helicase [Deltaproteobacteria bacterium]
MNDTSDETRNSTASPAAPPPDGAPGPSFAELGLGVPVLQALANMGFSEPMEVQRVTIPLVREGRDVLVQSRTGSGKTAAFAIPFADWIADAEESHPQAIVLLPTRELALQVAAETARICANTTLAVVPVYGGSPMGRQIEQLRDKAQIVCGTPGRVLDHIRRGTLKLDRIRCVVLDECDEMLSMGFQEDIETILAETPDTRQTLLFSATIPEGIQRLSRRFMRDPETLKLSADFIGVHEIRHTYFSIPGGQREAELLRILAFEEPERALIFCNTREETGRVADYLRRHGLDAQPISSDLSQGEREDVMQRMRAGDIRFLVATDVAARGIDIENLPCVINYTFPESPEIYIHRTGRTGRAGRAGHAISLIGPTEVGSFYYLKLLYKIRPEERSLPSEAEVRSRREGERLLHLRALLPGDPGPEWHSLARRLMSTIDAERLVGSLLRSALDTARPEQPKSENQSLPDLGEPDSAAATPAEEEQRAHGQPGTDLSERNRRFERRPRGQRERERPSRERGERERRERAPRRHATDVPPARAPAPTSTDDSRDFWEVWSEDVGRTAPPPENAATAPAADPDGRRGAVRLYVNLGRKDGATAEIVAEMLSASGAQVPAADVELMNTHSYVNVDKESADALCAGMNGRVHNGRSVVCEPARPPRRR